MRKIFFLFWPITSFAQDWTYKEHRKYDEFFPNYIETCAISKLDVYKKPKGGPAGHSVMFLKGACLDKSSVIPQIKLCSNLKNSQKYLNNEVGISVNSYFANVNWVAIPSRELFFYGNIDRNEILDEHDIESLIHTLKIEGYYNGIISRRLIQSNKTNYKRRANV